MIPPLDWKDWRRWGGGWGDRLTELEEDEEITADIDRHRIPTLCPSLYPPGMGWEKILDLSIWNQVLQANIRDFLWNFLIQWSLTHFQANWKFSKSIENWKKIDDFCWWPQVFALPFNYILYAISKRVYHDCQTRVASKILPQTVVWHILTSGLGKPQGKYLFYLSDFTYLPSEF